MKILVGLIFVLLSMPAFAWQNGQTQGFPFSPQLGDMIERSTYNGEHVHRFMHSFYDVNVQGGTTVGTYSIKLIGKGQIVSPLIPANAVIKQVYFYVKTPFLGTATSGTTFKLQCGNATLFSAADISTDAAGTFFAGNQTGTAANMSDVGTSACTPQVVIANQGYSISGQLDIYIDFLTHN